MILTFFTKDSAVPPHPAYAFDTHEIMLPTTNNRNGNDCRNCISETASCFLSMGFTYSIYKTWKSILLILSFRFS